MWNWCAVVGSLRVNIPYLICVSSARPRTTGGKNNALGVNAPHPHTFEKWGARFRRLMSQLARYWQWLITSFLRIWRQRRYVRIISWCLISVFLVLVLERRSAFHFWGSSASFFSHSLSSFSDDKINRETWNLVRLASYSVATIVLTAGLFLSSWCEGRAEKLLSNRDQIPGHDKV